jgi:dTDP-4-amino-4,6-dideoxygalactose transaminase
MNTDVTSRAGKHVLEAWEFARNAIGKNDPRMEAPLPIFMAQLPAAEALLPYLQQLDQSRVYSNFGPLVLSLQDRLAALFDMQRHTVVATGSGTAALVAGILALAGRGNSRRPYALCPAYTFVATASAVEQCGYTPYLADVCASTWLLDPVSLLHHPALDRIGVVVPVAAYGRRIDVEKWSHFNEVTGIPVVIDAAAGIEAVADGRMRPVGEVVLALSFHATKAFGCGEGGCLLASQVETVLRAAQTLNFGFMGSRDSAIAAFNGKMSEYHAAVAHAELDTWAAKRALFREVVACYQRALFDAGVSGCDFISAPTIASNYALYKCGNSDHAEILRAALEAARIESRFWYGRGLQAHPYFRDIERDYLPVTEEVSSCLVGLPMASMMTRGDVHRVVEILKSTEKRCK